MLDSKMNNNEMIKGLKEQGITDETVLEAMGSVDRKVFVLPECEAQAYDNNPLPIDASQTISQPYIVAYMTAHLKLKPTDRVLEIGTGSGYQAAILSKLCHHVYTLEVFEKLHEGAQKCFKTLGLKNITALLGNGYEGLESEGPYDAIMLTAAPEAIPETLIQQLGEGGRLCAPIGKEGSPQALVLLTKEKDKIETVKLCDVRFVPMI